VRLYVPAETGDPAQPAAAAHRRVMRRSNAVCVSARSLIPVPPVSFVGAKGATSRGSPGVNLDAMSEAQLERLHAGVHGLGRDWSAWRLQPLSSAFKRLYRP
jgi:hypothetical protein